MNLIKKTALFLLNIKYTIAEKILLNHDSLFFEEVKNEFSLSMNERKRFEKYIQHEVEKLKIINKNFSKTREFFDYLDSNQSILLSILKKWETDFEENKKDFIFKAKLVKRLTYIRNKSLFKTRFYYFKTDREDIFRFTAYNEKSYKYSFRVQKDFIELKILDSNNYLANNDSEIYTNKFPIQEELLEKLIFLESNFISLELKKEYNYLGNATEVLFEFPRIKKVQILDMYNLENYIPSDYKAKLVKFIDFIKSNYFPFLSSYLNVLSSPLSRMPVTFLQKYLSKERDILIASICKQHPSKNLKGFLDSLDKKRKNSILKIQESLEGEISLEVFREVERVLERKFFTEQNRSM